MLTVTLNKIKNIDRTGDDDPLLIWQLRFTYTQDEDVSPILAWFAENEISYRQSGAHLYGTNWMIFLANTQDDDVAALMRLRWL